MSNDYSRWIENSVYNSARQRISQLNLERSRADRKVSDAKRRLGQIDNTIANQSSIDRKELERKLSRESEKLLDGIDEVEENLRMELGRQNLRNREQLDAVRCEIGNVNVRVNQVGQRIQELATTITENINNTMSRIRNQEHRALAYYNQLRQIFQSISELNPDKLTPTEFVGLEQIIASVKSDIDVKDYSAAIGLTQNNIPEASALQAKLELLNDEFAKLIIQIHEQCSLLQERIRILSDFEKIESSQENIESFDGRVSFWTSGLFDEVVEEYEQVRIKVETDYEINMDIESLKLALEDITAVNQRLDECVSLAKSEYNEYINLIELTTRIHNVISSENSWLLNQSGFVSDDERRSFIMSYENSNGLTMVFVIVPVRSILRRNRDGSTDYSETHFNINVFQNDGNDLELCHLTREGILAILSENEIEICDNRRLYSSAPNCAESFIDFVAGAGDKIKNERILGVKERIGL